MERFEESVKSFDGPIVMDLDFEDYDGVQHIDYAERKVSRTFLDELRDQISESEFTFYNVKGERYLLRAEQNLS